MRGPVRKLDNYVVPRMPRDDREKEVWRAATLVTTIFIGGLGLISVTCVLALWLLV